MSTEKEEEERIRREEEEKLQKERDERERIALEEKRKREEQIRKKQEEERERIQKEGLLFKKREEKFLELLAQKKAVASEEGEWKKYIECSRLPNVDKQTDINSFLSVWRDNPNSEGEEIAVNEEFENAHEGINLFHSILQRYQEAKAEGDQKNQEKHKGNISLVVKATIDTLDDITACMMKYSDIYVQSDKFVRPVSDSIQYGLWVNISKKRLKQVEFESINVTCELALKGMTQKEIALRVMQLSFDPLTCLATHPVRFLPLGGVLYIETLDIPPIPMTRAGFKMREIKEISSRVNRVPYQDVDWEGHIEEPPTKVTFNIPNHVLIRSETPFVGWWDSKASQWKLNGISNTFYDPDSRRIEFSTTHLTTSLAVVHQRTFDVPYQQWYLSPLCPAGKNCAVLSLTPKAQYSSTASVGQIVFLIRNDKCKLIAPDKPELAHLFNLMMTPMELLTKMASSGINLILEDRDGEFIEYKPKSSTMERNAYKSISDLCSICIFSSSKWNQNKGVPKDVGIFQVSKHLFDPRSVDHPLTEDIVPHEEIDMRFVKQHLTFEIGQENEWDLMRVDEDKFGFVRNTEGGNELNIDQVEGLNTHLNMILALEEKNNSDLDPMIISSNQLLGDTVRILLNVVRPLGW